jgi:hypothetical protein
VQVVGEALDGHVGQRVQVGELDAIRPARLQRRRLNLKVTVGSGISQSSFKRLVPGGFNRGFIGTTGTALPSSLLYASSNFSCPGGKTALLGLYIRSRSSPLPAMP